MAKTLLKKYPKSSFYEEAYAYIVAWDISGDLMNRNYISKLIGENNDGSILKIKESYESWKNSDVGIQSSLEKFFNF